MVARKTSSRHCRDCNKEFIECMSCHLTFPTNVATSPEVTGHECLEESNKEKTAKAAAAGVAGGAAAGAAGGLGVAAGAPAALGAAGFTSSGVAGGSLAAFLQGSLYAGATPAVGWFATCTSAAMGGAMGAAAVTAVAATGGVAVAAGAGYGIYRYVRKKKDIGKCPWCQAKETNKDDKNKKNFKTFHEGDKQSENKTCKDQMNENEQVTSSDEGIGEEVDAKDEFICPICTDLMSPPTHIWQCGVGHILCQNCKNQPEVKTCPECRGQFTGRNLAMEKMARLLLK